MTNEGESAARETVAAELPAAVIDSPHGQVHLDAPQADRAVGSVSGSRTLLVSFTFLGMLLASMAFSRFRDEAVTLFDGVDASELESVQGALRVISWVLILSLAAMSLDAWGWLGRIPNRLVDVRLLASNGAGAAEAMRRVDERADADRNNFRSRSTDWANGIVLVGMFLTAWWLASKTPLFQQAANALSGGGNEMSTIVANLLGLGPKAFVSTAAAVAASLAAIAYGAIVYWLVSRREPEPAEVMLWWGDGHTQFRATEKVLQMARTEELVAGAMSTGQVQELQRAFRDSMSAMGNMLSGAADSLASFQRTAELIEAANRRLATVTSSLNSANLHVDSVTSGLSELTRRVEGYGDKLLVGTKEFTSDLIRDVSERIPEVVSAAATSTVREMQPHFTRLAHATHDELKSSAEALQQSYTDAFDRSLALARTNLDDVSRRVGELQERMAVFTGEMARTSKEWETASGGVVTAVDRVATAFAAAAGHGQLAATSTEAARKALVQAAASANDSAQRLARFADSAGRELKSIRADAELLGEINEATRSVR